MHEKGRRMLLGIFGSWLVIDIIFVMLPWILHMKCRLSVEMPLGIALMLLLAVLAYAGSRWALAFAGILVFYKFSPVKIGIMWISLSRGGFFGDIVIASMVYCMASALVLIFSDAVMQFQKHQRERRNAACSGIMQAAPQAPTSEQAPSDHPAQS